MPDFFNYTVMLVALGSAILGIVSGALGTFAVLRKQSLLGDAMSHAALPGICVAFILTQSKSPLALMTGAALAGCLGTLWVSSITKNTRIKDDSALGIVLSVFFGVGLVLLTYIQKWNIHGASQAGLDKFLLGQAAAILERDLVVMAALGSIALLVLALLWKEFKLLTFDPEFGACLGFPMRRLDILLTSLLVVAIVIGLQTVGVVLMSAMIVAPASAARQWTDRLGTMVFLSAGFGALSGVVGAVISNSADHIPAGPTIVLVVSGLVFVSLLIAPNRGLIWKSIRQRRQRGQLQADGLRPANGDVNV